MSNKYFSRIFLLFIPLLLASCSKWLDVNTDPNNPSDVAPELVLPVAQASVAGVVGGEFAILGGLWSQHWTQSNSSSQYKTYDAYDIDKTDLNVQWTEMYAGGLNDLETIKNQSAEASEWNIYLQATVLQVYGYQIFADFFDKIPFTEALKGVATPNPVFDDGEVVYDGLIARLDDALSKDFDATTVKQARTDLVFGSLAKDAQIDQWKRFANTLKLKIYMRQTESSRGAAALAAINAMYAAGTEFLSGDAAITQFVDEANRSNILYETNVRQLNTDGNLRLSRTFESFLKANNDLARLEGLFHPDVNNPTLIGMVQGNFEAPTTEIPVGTIAIATFHPTTPFFFISEDESYFLQAEALLRIGRPASEVKAMYDAATEASYAKFGFAFDPSIIGAGGAYEFPEGGSTAEMLEAIIVQKWVAMVNQGYESFLDQARTGYPRISAVPATDANYIPGQWTYSIAGVTGGLFPKRFLFPSASSDVNTNTPAVVPVTTKVWWMP